MSEFIPEHVLAIECPYCRAAPGNPCRTKTGGRYTGDFHVHRKGKLYPRFLFNDSGGPKRGLKKLIESTFRG